MKTIMPALLRHIAYVQYPSDLMKVNRITKLGLTVYLFGGPTLRQARERAMAEAASALMAEARPA